MKCGLITKIISLIKIYQKIYIEGYPRVKNCVTTIAFSHNINVFHK